jgi:hypothetical protein
MHLSDATLHALRTIAKSDEGHLLDAVNRETLNDPNMPEYFLSKLAAIIQMEMGDVGEQHQEKIMFILKMAYVAGKVS